MINIRKQLYTIIIYPEMQILYPQQSHSHNATPTLVYDSTLSFFVDLSGHIFPPSIETNPPSEDDNDFFTNTGNFNGNKDNEFISNSGNTINDVLPMDKDTFKKFPEGPQQQEEDMSAWTIYIIVGLVAGGVLLVGLVAIVVALCCNRIEDRNGYKHTSV